MLEGSIEIGPRPRIHLQTAFAKFPVQARTRTMVEALHVMGALLRSAGFVPTTVAHRLVHGGQRFTHPTRVTPGVLKQLRAVTPLAPLHMPVALDVLTRLRGKWPAATVWGVFDTAAFAALPPAAATYAIPTAIAKKYGIRKYGFHGISHSWALTQAAAEQNIPLAHFNAVTLHLGSGDSVARWQNGKPQDTTMGFTPLEGLAMSTRSGDLDPMIPLFLQTQAGMSVSQVSDVLNRKSGLLGLSGLSDMRDVLSALGHPVRGWPKRRWSGAEKERAQLAGDIFIHDAAKYVAAYVGMNGRTDAIVFTGAIGQNQYIQRAILSAAPITKRIPVVIVPTDESRAIANEVKKWYNRRA